MKKRAIIHCIGTAVPVNFMTQDDFFNTICGALPSGSRTRRIAGRIYRQSGIDKRHSVIRDFKDARESSPFVPLEPFIHNGPSTEYRNTLYIREAPLIAENAVRAAFQKIRNIDPGSITHLVTASCTGFSAPGLDLHLIKKFSMNRGINRYHLGFMGCLAAIPVLKMAFSICLSDPLAKVLAVCTELCSLHYRHRFDEDTLISNSLFADGAGAAVISSKESDGPGHGFEMKSFVSRIIDGTESDMGWIVGDHGFEMKLSRSVPIRLQETIPDLVADNARIAGIKRREISSWAVHPGGRAILDRLRPALGLSRSDLEHSYSILRNYGNMSSATLLFVLEKMLAGNAGGYVFAVSIGPGLTAESGILECF